MAVVAVVAAAILATIFMLARRSNVTSVNVIEGIDIEDRHQTAPVPGMTMLSVGAYLPFFELVRILAVTWRWRSWRLRRLRSRSSASTAGSRVGGVGNGLIAAGAGILILLVGLGLYALVNQ